MKINEVFDNESLNELGTTPMGIGSKMWAGVKSKVPGGIGRSATAQLDVGNRANELHKKFENWALRTGIDLTSVDSKEIDSFLKTEGIPNFDHKGMTSYNLKDPNQTKELWTAIAQLSYRASGVTGGQKLGQRFGIRQDPAVNQIMAQLADPTKLAAVKQLLGIP